MRIFHHPLLNFRSAVAMGKSGKLAAVSSGPVAAKCRLTFHLRVPLSTDLIISGDATLRNISSGCTKAPAAPTANSLACITRLTFAAGQRSRSCYSHPYDINTVTVIAAASVCDAVRCLSFALTDDG